MWPQQIQEHVKCSHEGCMSVYWRPQEAAEGFSTADIAQMHGWTMKDRKKGILYCPWGHEE